MGGIVDAVGGAVSGLFGGGKTPATPDYTGAAEKTAQGNLEAVKYQTQANRPTMVTPWGTSTWTQNGDNNWVNTVNLTPDAKSALDSQLNVQRNQSSLAQTLQGQVANTMKGGFTAPKFNDYMNGVGNVNTNFAGFNPSGVGSINTNFGSFDPNSAGHITTNFGSFDPSGAGGVTTDFGRFDGSQAGEVNRQGYDPNQFMQGVQGVNQNFGADGRLNPYSQFYTAGAGGVNLNAPQFSDANRQAGIEAAYKASVGLQQDGWDQDNKRMDEKLRLQGLTPGTEAYNTAMQNQLRVQEQAKTQLANQAVLTGSELANKDYASQLSGYQAGLGAQQQAFGQGMDTFSANNSAKNQSYANALQGFTATNDARNSAFGNQLSLYDAQLKGQQVQNAAQAQSFDQSMQSFGANQQAMQASNQAQQQKYEQALQNFMTNQQSAQASNEAQMQKYQQALQGYLTNQQSQQASNEAQSQQYQQALQGYLTNQQAIQAANQAQQQQYAQQLGKYQSAYQAALQDYLQPLNSMNAVLTGQQVQNPTFNGFATAGQAQGADYLGALGAQTQFNTGVANAKNAQSAQTMGSMASLASAAMMAGSF